MFNTSFNNNNNNNNNLLRYLKPTLYLLSIMNNNLKIKLNNIILEIKLNNIILECSYLEK